MANRAKELAALGLRCGFRSGREQEVVVVGVESRNKVPILSVGLRGSSVVVILTGHAFLARSEPG